jgi:hypothetical protein
MEGPGSFLFTERILRSYPSAVMHSALLQAVTFEGQLPHALEVKAIEKLLSYLLYLIASKVYATVFDENVTVAQNPPSQPNRFLLEKLIATQLVKTFPELFGTQKSITAFARSRLPSIF